MKTYKKNHYELKRVCHEIFEGKLNFRYGSKICGYNVDYLRRIFKRFSLRGDSVFIHGLTGVKPVTTIPKKTRKIIVDTYLQEYDGYNFKFFYESLKELDQIDISYKTCYKILTEAGIVSPEKRRVPHSEKLHRPRIRRAAEGELLQMDATPFQWFQWAGDNTYYALHGAVDDATGKLTALYMCQNECFYGYTELIRQTFYTTCGGHPEAVYTDRARIFCVPPKDSGKLSLEEQLQGLHEKRTQFQRLLDELNVKQILAWSPQAKGRVERMWRTVQGRLPWYFEKYKIKTIEAANIFLRDKFLDLFNNKFAVQPACNMAVWHKTLKDPDYVLSYRVKRHISAAGYFHFYGCKWTINRRRSAGIDVEVCITANSIKAYYDGKFYDVNILNDSIDIEQGAAPQVVKNIIYDCMYSDAKKECAIA